MNVIASTKETKNPKKKFERKKSETIMCSLVYDNKIMCSCSYDFLGN